MAKNLSFASTLRHDLALIALAIGSRVFLIGNKILRFFLIKLFENKVCLLHANFSKLESTHFY
jgi:hypothetical protein